MTDRENKLLFRITWSTNNLRSLLDEADPERLLGIDEATGEEHVGGVAEPDDLGQEERRGQFRRQADAHEAGREARRLLSFRKRGPHLRAVG